MTAWLASPLTVESEFLQEGMHVLRPAWIEDYETKKRYDPRVDVPNLPDVLRVDLWDVEDGESLLMAPDGSVGIDYNTADYPEEFVVVGPHTEDPVFRDAQDVGRDLKIQDPDFCQMIAWGAPWRRRDLTPDQEASAPWVMLTLCRPGFEAQRDWSYDVFLMRGEDDEDVVVTPHWELAVKAISDFRAKALAQLPAAADALEVVNRHRAKLGMVPLDPASAGWTREDVEVEARRIARIPNPLLDLKRRLLVRPNQGYAALGYPVFPVVKWNQTYVFPLDEEDDALLLRVAREERWRLRRMEGIGPHRFARTAYHVSAPDPVDDPVFALVEIHGWRGWWAEPARGEEGIEFWNFVDPEQTDKEPEADFGRLFIGPYANPEDDQVGLFGAQQAQVEGFALTSPKGRPVKRARPGRGTQPELVSRKVSAEKMAELRERELAERAAAKKRRKRKKAVKR